MKSVGIVAAILLALGGTTFAEEIAIRYSFDEADGARATDSGPLKAHATLVVGSDLPVTDVSFTTKTAGQWQPLLRGNVQVKGISPDGFRLMLDSEAPIIFDKGADYEVDLERGLLKPLSGGRMKEGDRVLVELSHRNSGPTRVAGNKGRALQFDGRDDFVECGEPQEMKALSAVTFDLWFQVGPDRNPSAVLIGKGEGLWIGFEQGALVFHHGSLKGPAGAAAENTKPAKDVPILAGQWLHLKASYANGACVILLDDREVARTDNVSGTIPAAGPLRLGGTVDPRFFAGLMDEVSISFSRASAASNP